MLNNFGRILIWLGVAAFVAPLIMTVVVMMQTTSAINKAFSGADDEARIASGMSSFEINRRTRQIKGLLAPRNAVAGAAASLTIAAMTFDIKNHERFDRAKELGEQPGSSKADVDSALATPHALAIDYGDATRRAVVVISTESLGLEVAATDPAKAIAVLGVESKVFPDVSKVKAGMLAGYRIEAAGVRTADPDDPAEANYEAKGKLCKSIEFWTKHFRLKAGQVDFVLFRDPSALTFDGSKWVSDGTEETRLYDTDIQQLCG